MRVSETGSYSCTHSLIETDTYSWSQRQLLWCYYSWRNVLFVWRSRCNRHKCPRFDCPPACKFPIRIITTPYMFIPWPLGPHVEALEAGQSSQRTEDIWAYYTGTIHVIWSLWSFLSRNKAIRDGRPRPPRHQVGWDMSHGNVHVKFHDDRLRNGGDITYWNFAETRFGDLWPWPLT